MNFEILIDSTLLQLKATEGIIPSDNKRLLSVINDYEAGKWRHEKFQNFVWDNIAETALTLKERSALKSDPHSLLVAAAKNLRLTDATDDIGKGSELAEIILYGIMKHKYRALPVVPKIFHKQNAQDNAKGADSVHIVVAADGVFSLWLGEAKFFNSIEDARFTAIITSIRNALHPNKLRKENSIIVNLPELDQLEMADEVRSAIKECLDNRASIDGLKPKLNIPILLLHECAITNGATQNTDSHLSALRAHHKERAQSYFQAHSKALAQIHKYAEIQFHLILFPVPAKRPIVDTFVKGVQYFKG